MIAALPAGPLALPLAVGLALASTGPVAQTPIGTVTGTVTGTPAATSTVTVEPPPEGAAVSYPVEEVSMPVQDVVFPTASGDGAVVDEGDHDYVLDSDVLFAFDSATLNARARRELTTIGSSLSADSAEITEVEIIGYTDNVGSADYNRALSRRRAAAVRAQLAPLLPDGVTLTARGLGEQDPVASNDSTKGRRHNRRVEIHSG